MTAVSHTVLVIQGTEFMTFCDPASLRATRDRPSDVLQVAAVVAPIATCRYIYDLRGCLFLDEV
jgi:hypothetical protein